MKILIILAAAVIAIAGIGLSASGESASPSENESITVTETNADINSETNLDIQGDSSEVKSFKYILSKIKSGIALLIDDMQSEEAKKVYESLEEEASVFVSKTFEKIKEKLPKDLTIELAEFNASKIEEAEFQNIKNKCKTDSKYNPEKINTGFNINGKIKIVSNGKDNLADISLVILKENDEWKVYDIECDFAEDISIKDFLTEFFEN